ncbi:TPR repeat-containing protein [Cylindrospermum sp. NIES-4074]|nr:TPR repeat-containing protein [Cylindrospermum sp. NIES-4074]
MDVEAALEYADDLVSAKTGKRFNDVQRAIFRGAWQGKTYKEIHQNYPGRSTLDHKERNVAPKLWKLLSEVIGEKVSKDNLQEPLKKVLKLRLHSDTNLQPQNSSAERVIASDSDFVGCAGALAAVSSDDKVEHQQSHWKIQAFFERVQQWDLEEKTPQEKITITSQNPNFLGRDEVITELNQVVSKGERVILIHAEGGVGKTLLAEEYLKELKKQGFHPVLKLYIREIQKISYIEDKLENWLKEHFEEEPKQNFDLTLDSLRDKLEDDVHRIVVLIDDLHLTLQNSSFTSSHYRCRELLKVLSSSTVQSVTLITSRELLHEPGIRAYPYLLKELKREVWEQYFVSSNIIIDADSLNEMYIAYGGNAEVMSVFSGDIVTTAKGNLRDYWQDNRDDLLVNPTLFNLIDRQFNKLKRENFTAYKLLCRLGFYTSQDVSILPKIWVFCLLWDILEDRQQIVNALRDRSLIKKRDNGYYLHPVIQSKAIADLKIIENPNGEKLLLIKKQIDGIQKTNQSLQHFLELINKKSDLVKVPCHPANVRAFYYILVYDLLTARHIAGYLGGACKFEGVEENVFDYDLVYEHLYDIFLDLSLVCTIFSDSYGEFYSDLNYGCRINDHNSDLLQVWQKFKAQIPEITEDLEKFSDVEWREQKQLVEEFWWQIHGQDWIEDLKAIVIQYRQLPLDIIFNDEQTEILNQYYDVNKLLIDCLNSLCNVSPEVRSHIEDTLLLPIAEIEKRQLERRNEIAF